jgi:hypothetical protein
MVNTGKLQTARDSREQVRRVQAAVQIERVHGAATRSLENRNRQQLYALAQTRGIPGRATMGKSELIEAIRHLH